MVKLKGGMPAKRTRAEVVHDYAVKQDDSPVVVAALQLAPPPDLAGFLGRMSSTALAEAFVEKIMAQKNSDRVLGSFANNFQEYNNIEVTSKNDKQY